MQQQNGEGAWRRKSDLLLTRMSHDVRTPMNSIVGLSYLCLQTELDSRQREYLEQIQSSALTLVETLNDILDFSRVESGRVELQSSPFRMTDLLQKISNTVSLRAEKKGLEVLFRVASDVPEYLEGDSHRLSQALVNLVSNAIRFTRGGEVIISVEALEWKDEVVHLHFAIQDTGIGMGKAQVEHIGRFFSLPLEDLLPEAHPDAGLGLALALMLVRLMGGKIWAESEAEGGSVFHVSLHLKAGAMPRSFEVSPDLLRDMHVLVVDDNASARTILSETLTSFGFRVQTAESGLDALDTLQEAYEQNDPFALVLLDWKMPGLDGVETAKAIKENPAIKTLPQLLMVSASDVEDCRRQGSDAGIRGFLLKPVTRSLLFDTIIGLFAKEKSGTEEDVLAVPDAEHGARQACDLATLRGARVLLVEDNEINQQIAVELLEQAGCVVITANNGKEALDILQQQQFDAVLMDIQMPIMDGLEAARRARDLSVPGIRALPILAMTAHGLKSDIEKSFQAGMQEHLTKPIDPKLMYESLAKWIRSGREPAQGAQLGAATPVGLNDMPGLSVQAALKNLGGNERLYKKLLKSFVESYEHVPEQLSDALAMGDRQRAVLLAHTIKGVAANLGASSLASASGALESALAGHKEYGALLAQMRDALLQAVESIRCLVSSSEQATPVVRREMSAERRAEAIAFLRVAPQRMASDWISVQQQLKDFEGLLGHSATASAYAAMMRAVDDFDADAAEAQAERIVALLQS